MAVKYKKRVRLKNFDYKGCYSYSITICTHEKKPVFKDSNLVRWLIDALAEKSDSYNFKIWAYCFMPDHLHLLMEGRNDDSDTKGFISSYKQHTGFYYKKKNDQLLWQINYYDHVLRKEEDITSVAQYIFGNPVRKGLVEDYRQYEFLGSFEFDATHMTP